MKIWLLQPYALIKYGFHKETSYRTFLIPHLHNTQIWEKTNDYNLNWLYCKISSWRYILSSNIGSNSAVKRLQYWAFLVARRHVYVEHEICDTGKLCTAYGKISYQNVECMMPRVLLNYTAVILISSGWGVNEIYAYTNSAASSKEPIYHLCFHLIPFVSFWLLEWRMSLTRQCGNFISHNNYSSRKCY